EGVELESFKSFASSTGQFDVVSLALERGSDHGPHRGFVIDNENPLGLAGCLLSAESGRGVVPLHFCELGSQTPASILFSHFLPLIRLIQPQRFYPVGIHCPATEPKTCCDRQRPQAPRAAPLYLRAVRSPCSNAEPKRRRRHNCAARKRVLSKENNRDWPEGRHLITI